MRNPCIAKSASGFIRASLLASILLTEAGAEDNGNGALEAMSITPDVTTSTDGDWSARYVALQNTSQAAFMVRVGDIDNLGFGWPVGFDPFTGASTPAHAYPWIADVNDPGGTDRIIVVSSFRNTPPYGQDGYASTTVRPGNAPEAINMTYNLNGLAVENASIQMFVDDFQAPVFKADYQIKINGKRVLPLEEIINNLVQTGPIGKLISYDLPSDFYQDVASGKMNIAIDDPTTGAGDGFSIDFVKLLVNRTGVMPKGIITGRVVRTEDGAPIPNAVVACYDQKARTDQDGMYVLQSIPAGLAYVTASAFKYQEAYQFAEVLSGQTTRDVNFSLDASNTWPQIVVEEPIGVELPHGSASISFGDVYIGTPVTRTIRVSNSGTAELTELAVSLEGGNVSDFSVVSLGAVTLAPGASTTFTATFTPTMSGARGTVLRITSSDEEKNPFDIALDGNGLIVPAPEIVVKHDGADLSDGITSLSFGESGIGTVVTKTFTVSNTGDADLSGLAVTLRGMNASDFAIGALGATSLAPGAYTSFTVTFAPQAAGVKEATLQIASNDFDENPFEINVAGTGVIVLAPEIVVEEPAGVGLVSGEAALNFGSSSIGTAVRKTVTVRNTGNANLSNLAVVVSGESELDFTITSLGTSVLQPGISSSLIVTFTPTAGGARSATLQIVSNDADENPFEISLSGTGVIPPAPEIVVEEPAGTNLADGRAALAFGNSNTGVPVIKTITVRNTGTADLTGLAVTHSGTNASDFALGALGSTSLAPGAGTTFTVTFTPSAAGARSAALQIASNDADENPFDISLNGKGVVPPVSEIVVEQGKGANKILKDNKSSRDFGVIKVKQSSKPMVFTIKNTGTAPLKKVKVTLSGKQAKDFKVVKQPSTSVAAGKSTQFKVVYKPAKAATSKVLLKIASDDKDENPFRVKLAGKGTR